MTVRPVIDPASVPLVRPSARVSTVADELKLLARGLARVHAAIYIGVSPSKFDEMVDDGRMPKPKCVDRRRVWDRHALDAAFDALPDADEGAKPSSWDGVE